MGREIISAKQVDKKEASVTFADQMILDSPYLKIGTKGAFLLAERALYFDVENVLVIADLHIGKLEYFRKKGIPMPVGALETTLDRLEKLIQSLIPETVIFLGDLLHTADDRQWVRFLDILKKSIPGAEIMLIEGNHDLLDSSQYTNAGIKVYKEMVWGEILFTHEPFPTLNSTTINIAGHVHPAAVIRGKGRQSLRLPCFYFGNKSLILPAFGHFTGSMTLKPQPGDQRYIIAEDKVIAIDT